MSGRERHYRDLSRQEIQDREGEHAAQFEALSAFAEDVYHGDIRLLVVTGSPGMGKSFTVADTFKRLDEEQDIEGEGILWSFVSGNLGATGLYVSFHEHKEVGQTLVADDADSILTDEISLNLLKAAADRGKEKRVISWRKEYDFRTPQGDPVPRSVEYNGSVIIITNKDLSSLVKAGARAEHLDAVLDRGRHLPIDIDQPLDRLVRIMQIYRQGNLFSGLRSRGGKTLTDLQQEEVMQFIDSNLYRFKRLTVRGAVKVGENALLHPQNWQTLTRASEFRK